MSAKRSILRAIKFLYPQTTRQRHEQLSVIVKLENETDSGHRILQLEFITYITAFNISIIVLHTSGLDNKEIEMVMWPSFKFFLKSDL